MYVPHEYQELKIGVGKKVGLVEEIFKYKELFRVKFMVQTSQFLDSDNPTLVRTSGGQTPISHTSTGFRNTTSYTRSCTSDLGCRQ